MRTTIKSVGYKNLKGASGDLDLAPATLLVGRNFTGKTRVLDAIKLALLGYHPGLDRTAKGIFALASGEEMSVMVTTDKGATVGRVWRRSGGSIAKKDFVPMGWPETPVVLLDANAYFGASDRGKAELLFGAINAGDWGSQLAQIQRTLAEKLGPGATILSGRDEGIQAFVNRALAEVEEVRSNAAAGARRYLGTVQGLAALSSKAAVPLDEDVMANLKKKRLELNAAQGKVAEAKRLAQLHENTVTPGENDVATMKAKVNELAGLVRQKEVEVERDTKRWEAVFKHDACPTCGSVGDAWVKSAKALQRESGKLLGGELLKLAQQRDAFEREIKEKEPKLAGARKRMLAADAKRLEECEEVVIGLNEEVAALERSLETYAEDQADRRRLKEANASHDEQAALAKRAEEAKKYLLGVKASLSERLFEPILKATHAFTDGILLGPLQFEDGALGMGRLLNGKLGKEGLAGGGRRFVHHSAFSGTEQAIVFAAFQASLATTAPIKLVMMDELGRIDPANKAQLLRNVRVAVNTGVIDQFVGVDVSAGDVEGFHVIEMR